MADAPDWPAYRVASKDSIFAVGMVSVNYARLEFAVQAMFGTILDLNADLRNALVFKMIPEMRDKLMREILPKRQDWPASVVDLVQHFIEAHKTCYENRNKLIHSNLMTGSKDAIVLYKKNRDGSVVLANPSLQELRGVADDMQTYFNFGLQVSNMINWEIGGVKPQAGDFAYRSWPDKPPLPIPLEYVEAPIPVTVSGWRRAID